MVKEGIKKSISVPVEKKEAFDKFVNQLNEWWPKEYTWSRQKLVEIRITPGLGGLCSEIGPENFRCDWGRVTDFDEHNMISFTWQISPQRVPEPDPERASKVTVVFSEQSSGETKIELHHEQFERHGEGAEEYQQSMDSEYGWEYILGEYEEYVDSRQIMHRKT